MTSTGEDGTGDDGYPPTEHAHELNPPPPREPALDMLCRGGNHVACVGPPGTACECRCHTSRPAAPEPVYPPGEFARVELPGYVSWVGWVAEETYAGAGVLVVRDISGTVKARVSAGAFRQVIPLALPKPGEGYDGQLALPAGEDEPDDGDYDHEEPF